MIRERKDIKGREREIVMILREKMLKEEKVLMLGFR